jgi:hypothetical protein
VAAFPLALLMSLVNNYIQIRVDGCKLCQQTRRPEPRGDWSLRLNIEHQISMISIMWNRDTCTAFVCSTE